MVSILVSIFMACIESEILSANRKGGAERNGQRKRLKESRGVCLWPAGFGDGASPQSKSSRPFGRGVFKVIKKAPRCQRGTVGLILIRHHYRDRGFVCAGVTVDDFVIVHGGTFL
jgi:hypothetical protein